MENTKQLSLDLPDYSIERIKKAMNDNKLNQNDVQELIGRSQSYLSQVFKKKKIDPCAFNLLCKVLELDKAEVLREPPVKTDENTFSVDFDKFILAMKMNGLMLADDKQKKETDNTKALSSHIDKLQERVKELEKEIRSLGGLVHSQNELITMLIEKSGTTTERLNLERAISFLKEKMKSGHCDESAAYREADELGIARIDLADARKELGIITSFKGYGTNAKSILIYSKEDK